MALQWHRPDRSGTDPRCRLPGSPRTHVPAHIPHRAGLPEDPAAEEMKPLIGLSVLACIPAERRHRPAVARDPLEARLAGSSAIL